VAYSGRPADLVLKIPFDLDEQGATDEKGFDRVTVEALDLIGREFQVAAGRMFEEELARGAGESRQQFDR
jgi:hypothetical protein